jgi:hypothetical protein
MRFVELFSRPRSLPLECNFSGWPSSCTGEAGREPLPKIEPKPRDPLDRCPLPWRLFALEVEAPDCPWRLDGRDVWVSPRLAVRECSVLLGA